MTGLVAAALEVKEKGSWGYLDTTMATPDLNRYLG
jgi:hypothetical protein